MTTGVIKTKKTRLYFATPLDVSSNDVDGVQILYVSCATGIQGLGGPADQIATTCLESDEQEYEQGMANPGQLTVPVNFIPQSRAHQALVALKDSGDKVSWMIVLSDAYNNGDIPNSVTGSAPKRLVSQGPTTAEFVGYVADFNIDIQTNEIVRATLTIQRSGAVTWDFPAATV